MEQRKQFTFYRSYYEALRKLPESGRLAALEAVIAFALDGTEPQGLDDMQEMAFMLIRPTLEASRKKALAGINGAAVTNRMGSGKKKKEIENKTEKEKKKEKENEIENECLTREGFERFWDIYPVKMGKEAALDVWLQTKADADTVCDGVLQWRDSDQWRREDGRFIPRAAKFLQERHFDHTPRGYVPRGASGIMGAAELEAIARIMQD